MKHNLMEARIRDEVKRAIVSHINHPVGFEGEVYEHLKSLPIMEAASPVYSSNKTEKIMVLSNAANDETYIISKTSKGIEGVHVTRNDSKKVSFPNDQKLKVFIGEKSAQGFTVARNSKDAGKAVKRNTRGIFGFIKKHGIKVGIGAALIALAIALLPAGFSDSVRNIAVSLGIADADIDPVADTMGWLPLTVESTPTVDISGVNALMQAISSASEAQWDTIGEMEDLIARLTASGDTETASTVQQSLDALRQSNQSEIMSDISNWEAANRDMAAQAQDQATQAALASQAAQAARDTNSNLMQNIMRLQDLHQRLVDSGNDTAAQGILQNIRNLQLQMRSL